MGKKLEDKQPLLDEKDKQQNGLGIGSDLTDLYDFPELNKQKPAIENPHTNTEESVVDDVEHTPKNQNKNNDDLGQNKPNHLAKPEKQTKEGKGFFGTLGSNVFAKPWTHAYNQFRDQAEIYDEKSGNTTDMYTAPKVPALSKGVNGLCGGIGFLANGACKMTGNAIKFIGKGVGKVGDFLESGDGVIGHIGKFVSATTIRPLETTLNITGNTVNAVGDVVQDSCKLVGATASLPLSMLNEEARGPALQHLKNSIAQTVSSPIRAASHIIGDTGKDLEKQGNQMKENGSPYGHVAHFCGHGVQALDNFTTGPLSTVVNQTLRVNPISAIKGAGYQFQAAGYHMGEAFHIGSNLDPDKSGRGRVFTDGEKREMLKEGITDSNIKNMTKNFEKDQLKHEALKQAIKGMGSDLVGATHGIRTLANGEIKPPEGTPAIPKGDKVSMGR